jgi:hypothetical protein
MKRKVCSITPFDPPRSFGAKGILFNLDHMDFNFVTNRKWRGIKMHCHNLKRRKFWQLTAQYVLGYDEDRPERFRYFCSRKCVENFQNEHHIDTLAEPHDWYR